MRYDPIPETSLVFLSLASALSKLRPNEIRNLTIGDPTFGDPGVIRSAHINEYFLVHLGDVLLLSAVATPVKYEGDDRP